MATAVAEFPTSVRAEIVPTRAKRTAQSLFQCLIVTNDPNRVELFERAAAESGWTAVTMSEPGPAYVETRRNRFALVIVDLQGFPDGSSPDGYRHCTEQIARNGGSLLMICGHDGDALEEIWARQYGAWLYLPGVDATCDLAMLCGEAQKAAKKLFPELGWSERFARSA